MTLSWNNSAQLTASLIGALVVLVLLVGLLLAIVRRRRGGRRAVADAPSTDRLSRSSVAAVTDPMAFGAGSLTATITNRRETVAYGYLGVGEEYVSPETGATWSILSVTLPGWVPYLVLDHRTAAGRPGVPAVGGPAIPTGDPAFDALFIAAAADPAVIDRVLTPPVRLLLAHFPLQRLSLSGRTMLLRTFDTNQLTDTVVQGLDLAATEFLSTAPSFVMTNRPTLGEVAASLPTTPDPLREGFYGPQ
jgi:hypothetical protein